MKKNLSSSCLSISKHPLTACCLRAFAGFVLFSLASGPAVAQSTFITTSGNQSWGTAANWTPSGVPNAVNAAVLFNSPTGGNQAINSFGIPRTVGQMTIANDSTNTFSITTSNTLIFDVSTGNAALTVAGTGNNLTTFGSNLDVVLNDSVQLSVTNTASTSADGALKINGIISGTGRILKSGAGTVTLAALNTFAGGLSILEGTVRISAGTGVGAVPGSYVADQITLNGGTLEYTGSGVTSSSNRGFALGGSTGTISVTGTGTYQIGAVVSDVAGQSGALRKTGAGTLYLNPDSASTFSGGTTIVSGILQFGISGSLGTGTVTLGSAGGGSATLESVRGGYTAANNINVAAGSGGTLMIHYSGTGAFNSTFSGAITLNDNLTVRSDAITGQALRLTGTISGTSEITKTGTGTLRLENNNAGYSGILTISSGTVQLGNGGTTGGIGTASIINQGTLVINRTNSLTLNNGMNGSGMLIQAGTGTTSINNDNSYAGGTQVAKGTLQIGRSNSLGTGAVMIGSTGGGDATLDNYLAGWTTANDITTASGSGGTLTLEYSSSATGFGNAVFTGAITLNDDLVVRSAAGAGTSMRLTGLISGTGGLTKTGPGITTLTNGNTYSGTTTVSSGTLVVTNSAGSATGTGSVVVASALGGTGRIAPTGTNGVTVSGAVQPGVAGTNNGIGTLSFIPVDGNVTFQSGSSITFELFASGVNDKIVFSASGGGVLDFSAMAAGSINVTFAAGQAPALNQSFDLLDWAAVSGTGIKGLSTSLLDLSTAGFDPSWSWDTTQFTTSGVITITTLVPEPSRTMLALGGAAGVRLRRRRVRRE